MKFYKLVKITKKEYEEKTRDTQLKNISQSYYFVNNECLIAVNEDERDLLEIEVEDLLNSMERK